MGASGEVTGAALAEQVTPTPYALRQARHLSRALEGVYGPPWEQPGTTTGQVLISPMPHLEEGATGLQLASGLAAVVQVAVARYRRALWVLILSCPALAMLVGVAAVVAMVWTGDADSARAVLFVGAMLLAALLVTLPLNWSRVSGFAYMPLAGSLMAFTRALGDRLSGLQRAERVALLDDWRRVAPFAVAWLEGSWGLSSLVRVKAPV